MGGGGGGGESSSMKCVFTSSQLPSVTVMAKIHVASTVGKRSLGVHCCVS